MICLDATKCPTSHLNVKRRAAPGKGPFRKATRHLPSVCSGAPASSSYHSIDFRAIDRSDTVRVRHRRFVEVTASVSRISRLQQSLLSGRRHAASQASVRGRMSCSAIFILDLKGNVSLCLYFDVYFLYSSFFPVSKPNIVPTLPRTLHENEGKRKTL